MSYSDYFVLAVNRADLGAYKVQAEIAGKLWRELGATSYSEYAGDDVPFGKLTSFPRAIEAKEGQVVVIGVAVYADKAARDAVSGKVMSDPRMRGVMQAMRPFGVDLDHMIYGGFETLVEL